METGEVNKRLQIAMEAARTHAAEQRRKDAEATAAWDVFLEHVATPVARQLANALKVHGIAFTLFTPSGGLRLASDRQRDDFVELTLEKGDAGLQATGRVSHVRGSRTREEAAPIKEGVALAALTEEDVLAYFLRVLRPWLER